MEPGETLPEEVDMPEDGSARMRSVCQETERTAALLEQVGEEIDRWDGDHPPSAQLVERIETVEAALTHIEAQLRARRPAVG